MYKIIIWDDHGYRGTTHFVKTRMSMRLMRLLFSIHNVFGKKKKTKKKKQKDVHVDIVCHMHDFSYLAM